MTDKQLIKKLRGNRLRRFREYMGESHEKFAEVLNLHAFRYKEYERGLIDLSPGMQEKLNLVFCFNPGWYKDGEGEMIIKGDAAAVKRDDKSFERVKRDDILRYVGNHTELMIAIDELIRFYQYRIEGHCEEGSRGLPVFQYDFTPATGDELIWPDILEKDKSPI